jgi:hypothetical protein
MASRDKIEFGGEPRFLKPFALHAVARRFTLAGLFRAATPRAGTFAKFPI